MTSNRQMGSSLSRTPCDVLQANANGKHFAMDIIIMTSHRQTRSILPRISYYVIGMEHTKAKLRI